MELNYMGKMAFAGKVQHTVHTAALSSVLFRLLPLSAVTFPDRALKFSKLIKNLLLLTFYFAFLVLYC